MKVLVTDSLSEKGLDILRAAAGIELDVRTGIEHDDLKRIIGDYHALIIRSRTHVTSDILRNAGSLKVIGRAGVGIDNVDVHEATRRGIVVMNSPEGNTISTCELTMAMILSLSRRVAEASASTKTGEWDRKRFKGMELQHKTLGIIGLGRIGQEVAARAAAFGMNIISYDPFCPNERAERIGAKLVALEELFKTADIITLHVPLTDDTRGLIGPDEFKIMKRGVKIVNCARGGIINEQALHEAICDGVVSGCALDVYQDEPPVDSPLLALDEVIATPHIGAVTGEAQDNVAIDIATQVIDALEGRHMKNAVNLPEIDRDAFDGLRPYVVLAEKLGMLLVQMMGTLTHSASIHFRGEINDHDVAPLTRSFACGLLKPVLQQRVTMVNAPVIARERGLEVIEIKSAPHRDYISLITVEGSTGSATYSFSGTIFAKDQPRIVRVDGLDVDIALRGPMLICHNLDRPGAISHLTTVLARRRINVARMAVGRDQPGGRAVIILNIDEPVTDEIISEIKGLEIITDVKLVQV
ncbi:MAG: phosphoglycerate dehydrogenase [Planctomycetes bacterium]|nr:phosphoglycerate dehydrogenase [Planctomycetota bacterium]